MSTSSPWGFNRSSVVDQAAAALRQAIHTGELGDPLPGEYELAERLGISRPSVRLALARLAAEGLVIVKKGFRSRLREPGLARSAPVQPAVCVVCASFSAMPFFLEHPLLLEMHAEFAGRGVRWEVLFETKLLRARVGARLEQLVAARPQVCWILFSVPEPVQHWFVEAGVPVLVLGSCSPDLRLPSADIDYRAVGWHAAGTLVRHGHRHMALILPSQPLPGDRAAREGFMRYIQQRTPGLEVLECNVPEQPAQRRARLDRLFSCAPRPTALLIMRPALTIAVMTHVLSAGLRIPQDVSIVSRDTHPLLDSALPELTCYSSSARKLALRAVRLAMLLLSGRNVAAEPSLVTPTFVPGVTLARRAPGNAAE